MAWTTRELLAAKKEGAKIQSNQGCDVGYFPRHKGDRLPWLMKGWPDEPRYRRSAANCRPVGQNGGPWALARLLRIDGS